MSCNLITHNLYWVAGNTEQLDLRLLDEEYNVEDLTGASVKIGLKASLSDAITALTVNGSVEGLAGKMFIDITQAQTSSLIPAGKNKIAYFYAVSLTDSNGHTSTVLEGRVFVSRSIFS